MKRALSFALGCMLLSSHRLHASTSFTLNFTMDLPSPFLYYGNPNYSGVNNCGIGTSAPLEALDVNGDIRIGGQASDATGIITPQAMLSLYNYNFGIGKFSDSGTTQVGTRIFTNIGYDVEFGSISPSVSYSGATVPPYMLTEANFVPALSLSSAGMVGIGTTSATHILEIMNGGQFQIATGNTDMTVLGTDLTLSNTNSRIQISGLNSVSNSGDIQLFALYPTTGSTSDGNHIWYTTPSLTPVEQMRLTSTGSVGLGTTTPFSPLSIAPTVKGEKIQFYSSTPTVLTSEFGIGVENTSTNPRLIFHADTSSSSVSFGLGSSAEFDSLMTITGNPIRVGIGTTSPAKELSVGGSVGVGVGSNSPPNGSFLFGNTTGNTFIGDQPATSGGLNFLFFSTSGTAVLNIGPAGTVNLGATSSSYPLTVSNTASLANVDHAYYKLNGTAAQENYSTGGGNNISIHAVGGVVAQEFDATSDQRLKEEISDISSDETLHFLNGSRPVHFKWKNSNYYQYGFIAQDILHLGFTDLIVPVQATSNSLLIRTTEEDGTESPEGIQLTVNYSQLTALLTQGTKLAFEKLNRLTRDWEQANSTSSASSKVSPLRQQAELLQASNQEMKKTLENLQIRILAAERELAQEGPSQKMNPPE